MFFKEQFFCFTFPFLIPLICLLIHSFIFSSMRMTSYTVSQFSVSRGSSSSQGICVIFRIFSQFSLRLNLSKCFGCTFILSHALFSSEYALIDAVPALRTESAKYCNLHQFTVVILSPTVSNKSIVRLFNMRS